MRVIYLHQYFNTPKMGGGTRSFEMARRLVDKGHSVTLITSCRDQSSSKEWFVTDEAGINVHWLPVPYSNDMSYKSRLYAFCKFATKAAVHAARLEGDVIFATSTPLTIAVPAIYAAKRLRIPMVFEVRDLWPEAPIVMGALRNPIMIYLARKLERIAYHNSHRIVALSPGMAEGITKTGYPRERVRVIPNSCDLDLFTASLEKSEAFRKQHPELGDGPIVLYAGTLGRVNAVEYMVHLAKKVDKLLPKARFVIIGSGSERDNVRKLAVRTGVLNRNLFMYDRCSKEKISNAFSAASIVTSFVAPIRELDKNSANKFFDGLAAGRALAINYGGWQADLIHEHQIGLVLSHCISESAHDLVHLLQDRKRLEIAGANARLVAEAKFSRDRLAQELESVLLEVAE